MKLRRSKDGENLRRMVNAVAQVLQKGEPTVFRFEAVCRHALRGALCLSGRSWHFSDAIAADVVGGALELIDAKRPAWMAGQPEFTAVPGFAPAERYFCARCSRPMPEDRRLYCSRICSQGAANERRNRELREDSEAEREALKRLRRLAKSDYFAARRTITCAWCGGLHEYKAGANARTYCSRSCAAKGRHAAQARDAA